MSDYVDLDPFWVKNRADFLAERSTFAAPTACGTCRGRSEAGDPVEHDECQQRATLLQAPDHPYYEILAGFPLEENEKLPPRFHVPVFDDCGQPNAWLCAVCWEEGQVVGWPCATATKYGAQVFTPMPAAETEWEKRTARIAELEAALADARTQALAEAKNAVVEWLVKKAHEGTEVSRLADKVERGAIRLFHDAELAAAATEPQHYDKIPDPLDGCHWCACGNRWPCKDAPAVTA
ncbi:hypothetical protein [Streptomyces triticiradicis]|uniref:Uncharacterized protein n=1 Tax=Streptomyces triticiradicis TaxID=2651189 RepID=A0A7J5D520_9ACTN|nr:hypothetical protein [Streptomyces triticiradicis]KAB1979270.1 hypothetical protein F8144_36510 [Streptomyces triticiradicis]